MTIASVEVIGVVAAPTIEDIITNAAGQHIVAIAPVQGVIAGTPVQIVKSIPTFEHVIASATEQIIVTRTRVQAIDLDHEVTVFEAAIVSEGG